jgi:hypothetical protein
MRYNICRSLRPVILGMFCLAGAAAAQATEKSLEFTLEARPIVPPGLNDNDLSLTVNSPLGSDTQTTTASGGFSATLYADFGPAGEVTVNGLAFVQRPAPGGLSFTDLTFFKGGMTTKGLLGDLNTASPPGGVNPDGSFPTDGHALILNGGTLTVLGTPTDLIGSPLDLNLKGFIGSLVVSAPTIVGNQATYNVTLMLPADFNDWPVPGMDGTTISAHGNIRGVGSFTQAVPEPGTLALLAAGLAGLLAFAWRKR